MRAAYTEGALNLTVGSELIDDAGKAYPLPVTWATRYPPDVQKPFGEILQRLPEGSEKVYASCPRPTTAGAYRVLGIGVLLTLFGVPSIFHVMPSSSFEESDPMLVMTQMFAFIGGLGTLALGFVDWARAKKPDQRQSRMPGPTG